MMNYIFKIKNAFTLAEILITLGVIGVVSAVTLPALAKNYQKHTAVTQLKKTYTELSQALKYAETEYGDINNWDWNTGMSSLDFFNKYFSRYIKIKENKLNDENVKYYNISGREQVTLGVNQQNKKNSYVITTNSGYQIFFWNKYQVKNGIWLYIDTNGSMKKPNTFGKDVFVFSLIKNKSKFQPVAFDDGNDDNPIIDRNTLKNGPSRFGYQCNKTGIGLWCGALIMMDGWKISDDYPW